MTIQINPAAEPTEQTNDHSSLPASAFPPGVSAADYTATLTTPAAETEGDAPAAEGVETPAEKPSRPDHIPEKFWNADAGEVNLDALLKSYKALEDKQFNKATPETPESETETPPAAPLADVFTEFTTAFEANNGDVGEDIVAKLVAAGIPEYAIETWKVGYQVQSNEPYDIAHRVAGGQEAFDKAMVWAERGLSETEIAKFNAGAASRDTISMSVEWLMQRYNAAHPSEGKFVHAQSSTLQSDIFRSHDEMMAAIRAPNYSDPAVQQDILAKIARSKEAGTL